jgi:hypothetical protein
VDEERGGRAIDELEKQKVKPKCRRYAPYFEDKDVDAVVIAHQSTGMHWLQFGLSGLGKTCMLRRTLPEYTEEGNDHGGENTTGSFTDIRTGVLYNQHRYPEWQTWQDRPGEGLLYAARE